MQRISIFSTSNRDENRSLVFAQLCANLLEDQGVDTQIYDFKTLMEDVPMKSMYEYENSPLNTIVEKYLTSVDKLIFVIPEYNGSFPGILKLFIDSVHPSHFKFKKAALIGISSGRAGNIRGMDHLTGILNYLKVDVYHHKLPISSIAKLISNGKITDELTIHRIEDLIKEFLKF